MLGDCGRGGQLPGVTLCKCIKVKWALSQKKKKKKSACSLNLPGISEGYKNLFKGIKQGEWSR